MEFQKERVFTSLNADELREGDKVIVADDLATLKRCVKDNSPINTLSIIKKENFVFRFSVKATCVFFSLAYLVERKRKAEKSYRPFKDTDELVKVWEQKWSEKTNGQKWHNCKLNMPYIWVRKKLNFSGLKGELITRFEDSYVDVNGRTISLHVLFTEYEFLDGSPCGVEE